MKKTFICSACLDLQKSPRTSHTVLTSHTVFLDPNSLWPHKNLDQSRPFFTAFLICLLTQAYPFIHQHIHPSIHPSTNPYKVSSRGRGLSASLTAGTAGGGLGPPCRRALPDSAKYCFTLATQQTSSCAARADSTLYRNHK